MGIRLLPSASTRWYTRANTATALLSAALAAYWGINEFVFTDAPNASGLDITLAILAAAHAVFGLTLFFVLAAHHPRIAGFISFILFFLVSAYALWISTDATSIYFGIILIASMMSGLYGILIAMTLNASVITLLLTMHYNQLGGGATIDDIHILLYSAASIMTLILWSALSNEAESGEPRVKLKRKKRKDGDKGARTNVSTDVLINSITDGVAIIGNDGAIQEFNPSAQQITGWSEDETVGLDHRSVLVLTDQKDIVLADEANPITKSLLLGEPTKTADAKLQTRSDKHLEIDVLASPIHDGNKVTATVVIFRDVSKQRGEERQRAEFISTASHEMRTPVAAIEGYLALAMNNKVAKIDTAAKGYLDKAHASTQHLGKLFQDLLTAAKSEDGRLTNNPEVVDVGVLLEELIEGMRFTAEKKSLRMESDLGGTASTGASPAQVATSVRPVAYVYVDPERIREVITNLFDNAIKYTDEGRITIGMTTNETHVTINVTDTGAGIPKEDVPHLFQKFYRVDNSATRQVGGTGLGLFISRKIVELYNGRLWVESEVNQGSTFFISLPRLASHRAEELMQNTEQSKLTSMGTMPAPTPAIAPQKTTTTAADGTVVTTVDATKQQ